MRQRLLVLLVITTTETGNASRENRRELRLVLLRVHRTPRPRDEQEEGEISPPVLTTDGLVWGFSPLMATGRTGFSPHGRS